MPFLSQMLSKCIGHGWNGTSPRGKQARFGGNLFPMETYVIWCCARVRREWRGNCRPATHTPPGFCKRFFLFPTWGGVATTACPTGKKNGWEGPAHNVILY